MSTTGSMTTQSPGTLMIGGRQFVLIQHVLEPVQIAEARRLWRGSLFAWGFLLLPLNVANGRLFDTNGWVLAGTFAALFMLFAMRFFGNDRSVVISPVTVSEEDRNGTESQLAISTREGTVIATAHTHMADFLLRSAATDRTRRARLRREIPTTLRARSALWHEWNLIAAMITTFAAFIVIEVMR